jgi:hypothetical protein
LTNIHPSLSDCGTLSSTGCCSRPFSCKGFSFSVRHVSFHFFITLLILFTALGLQFGWRNLQWASSIPPVFVVLAFKIYISRSFGQPFRHYKPTPTELSQARVHSERADNKGNRLQRRFGHPALHVELFTPMLHANMMPLLPQVFSGKIGMSTQKMSEFAGQKVDTTVVQGGIKIAGIEQVRPLLRSEHS